MTATIESSQLAATLFAIREINDSGGIDGRELVPLHYDPQSKPANFRGLATRLVQEDRVNVIFGCYMSSTRQAVLPVVERFNRLLFYPTLYEGFEYSQNVIYTGAAPNQNAVPLARYMARHYGPRVYIVGSDYIYPYETNRTMTDLLLGLKGGAKLGERYVKLTPDRKDFTSIVADIKVRQPDFIFSTVVGASTRFLYEAFAEAGLDARRMPIASLTTSEAELAEMSPDAAAGHLTAATYFESIDQPRNRQTVERFRALFGARIRPNMCWEAAYFQIHLYANAMRRAGSDEIDRLLPALLGQAYDAPQGRVHVVPENHHTVLYPRIARVDAGGRFEVVDDSGMGVVPEPYMVSIPDTIWNDTADLPIVHG